MRRLAALHTGRLGLEGIDGAALRLGPGRYRAVLEVGGLSFGLLGEAEQETLFAAYAHWLKGLDYPIQLLVRVLPLDLRAHLDALEELARGLPPALGALARDHMTFLQGLARERTLLERHLYVVVPAGDDAPAGRWCFGRRREPLGRAAALAQLAARCDDVTTGLRACRLGVRRLGGDELLALLHGCWRPEPARVQRLGPEHRLPQLVVRGVRVLERSIG